MLAKMKLDNGTYYILAKPVNSGYERSTLFGLKQILASFVVMQVDPVFGQAAKNKKLSFCLRPAPGESPRPLARGQKVSRHTSGWSRRSPISLYVFQRVLFSLNIFGRAFEFVARCTSRLSHSHAVERARSTGVSPNS